MNLRLISLALLLLNSISTNMLANETTGISSVPVNPLSISGLRNLANSPAVEFTNEFERPEIDGIKRRVVSFSVDGLHQFALILTPTGKTPHGGWPVLLMNHGHHPNPPQYGRVASGETDRPGDYYRALPLAFTKQGFLVVVPDFRGHNDSEGLEFAHGPLESSWYARDSIVAFNAIDSLPDASQSDRFMWGHSMGGAVTLRALLALKDRVRGASIWSSTSTDAWKSALYYSLRKADLEDQLSAEKPALETLNSLINSLPFEYKTEQGDVSRFVDQLETPLNIHHSILDLESTPFDWSVELAGKLYAAGMPYHFYSYSGDKHLFEGENLSIAIQRDVTLFRNLLEKKGNTNQP